jgi:hypothetical protein
MLAFHPICRTLGVMSVKVAESVQHDLRLANRLRKIGVTVLLLGALCAGFVYWHGRNATKLDADPSMGGVNKANQRQMELMYGKMGTMTEDFVQWLKRPGTQSAVIGAGSVLVAAGCFYFARLATYPGEPEAQK